MEKTRAFTKELVVVLVLTTGCAASPVSAVSTRTAPPTETVFAQPVQTKQTQIESLTPTQVAPVTEKAGEFIVTQYPWNWSKDRTPNLDFVANLPAFSKERVFADYLEVFTPQWGPRWGREEKRKYLLGVFFIAEQVTWWQDNLCWNKDRADVYEFSVTSQYHANAAGAQQFIADLGSTSPALKDAGSDHRRIEISQDTITWKCDSQQVNLDVKTAWLLLHRHNISAAI